MHTLHDHAEDLEQRRVRARDLVEQCLDRIAAPGTEGTRTFLEVYATQARASADAIDALRRVGRAPSRYAGLPISLKDLLDVAGEPTLAASRALADTPPAPRHAAVVRRVLGAGLIPVGRTNMTEFAFSGIGINPHYGTPRNPWRREEGHIPGGSSSGAAVSVADGMAMAAIGTDTGGSCRIPAALCGVVGYKPTARRVPLEGVLPLSPSLDSVGPLANTVTCCAIMDAILAGEEPAPPRPAPLGGVRLAAPTNIVLNDMDAPTANAFQRALTILSNAGARIEGVTFLAMEDIPETSAKGGFAAAEAWAWHHELLAEREETYDPRVRARILRGAEQSAADYIALLTARADIIARMAAETAPYDALVLPTCPIAPPRIDDLVDDAAYTRANHLLLRNPSIGNFLDRCAISLPCHLPGEPPAGLMLMGETMGDHRLFGLATAVEAALAADA